MTLSICVAEVVKVKDVLVTIKRWFSELLDKFITKLSIHPQKTEVVDNQSQAPPALGISVGESVRAEAVFGAPPAKEGGN